MDKKPGRHLQPLSKGSATDKKNQENYAKQWSKGGTRREPALGTLPSKPDRKPVPQRSKAIDKRPKPRGRPEAVARDEASGLTGNDIELGSVFYPGSKKQSLNHLLNFTFASRDGRHPSGQGNSPNKYGSRSLQTKKHKYNKEHFLQANCQFIVNSFGDYKQYMNNPDALVDWDYIEQINVQVNDDPSCPICLYPPVAAKMTRCGHIYCWSCILHYLFVSEKSSQNCPICHENVQKTDLKSVVSICHEKFNVNERITFKLMKRLKGSLLAFPADIEISESESMRLVSDSDIYAKLLLADNADVLNIIGRERRELNHNTPEESEICFYEEAMVQLNDREHKIMERMMQEVNIHCKLDQSMENQLERKCYYFYQASDGQHIYIHAINACMLEHAYGSLECAPRTITGKILAKEGGSMTEELRARFKYLQHLPITCQFEMAEIELLPPVVGKPTMEYFKDQLELRRRKRARKAREEKKREKRIAVEENIKMGRYPTVHIPLESIDQFPSVGFEPGTSRDNDFPNNSEEYSDIAISPPVGNGLSFAKMLTSNKPLNNPWPGLKNTSSTFSVSSTSPTSPSKVTNRSMGDEDDSDHELVPELNRCFGDVIAEALKKASQTDEATVNRGKGKKKKTKQKLLLSTSLGYSGHL